MPCAIELVRVSSRVPAFYEFGQYEHLVEVARRVSAKRWRKPTATRCLPRERSGSLSRRSTRS
jgi:hypothetical protein